MLIRELSNFYAAYGSSEPGDAKETSWGDFSAHGVLDLLNIIGGQTFNFGAYRLHTSESALRWASICSRLSPISNRDVVCFGYDWAGRQFILNEGYDGLAQSITLLDPETGECFLIPQSFCDFHNEELAKRSHSAFASTEFFEWFSRETIPLNFQECVGLSIPMRLGGQDILSNRERTNMEVYWDIQLQILE